MGFRLGFFGLILALAVLTAAGLGLAGPSGLSQGIGQQTAAAAPLAGDNGSSDEDNGDSDEDNGDEDNDGGDNEDGDNEDGDSEPVTVVAAPPPPPPAPPAPCAGAGQEQVYSSPDGRVAVRVPAALGRRVRIQIQYVDPGMGPSSLVDRLVFDVQAQDCDTGAALAELPGEVNLGIHYAESPSWPNEQAFTIAQPGPAPGQWTPTQKQAPDPGDNYVSASISRMGMYSVSQG